MVRRGAPWIQEEIERVKGAFTVPSPHPQAGRHVPARFRRLGPGLAWQLPEDARRSRLGHGVGHDGKEFHAVTRRERSERQAEERRPRGPIDALVAHDRRYSFLLEIPVRRTTDRPPPNGPVVRTEE